MKRIRPKNSDHTFSDDYTKIFDDIIITPKGVTTKYGSYTDKRWNDYKLYSDWLKYHDQETGSIKGEPGLKLTYPEFDIISSAPSRLAKEASRFKNWGGIEFNYDRGGLIKLSYLGRNRNQLGHIDIRTYDGIPEISMIKSSRKGAGRKMYDAGIQYVTDHGMPGIYSGKNLLSAPKTYSMWKHYPDKLLVGMNGTHSNFNMPGVKNGPIQNISREDALRNWSKNRFSSFDIGEIYLLKSPSSTVLQWTPYELDISSISPLINPIIGHTITE